MYICIYMCIYICIHIYTYVYMLRAFLSLCSDRKGWYGLAFYQFLQGGLSASGGRARTHCIVCRFTPSFVREGLSPLTLELQTLACYNPTPLFPGAGLWRCSSCGVSETHNHGPSPSFCTGWPKWPHFSNQSSLRRSRIACYPLGYPTRSRYDVKVHGNEMA